MPYYFNPFTGSLDFSESGEVTNHAILTNLDYENSGHTGFLPITGEVTGATSQAQTFTNGVITGKIYPASDSTTALQLNKADGTTNVLNIDTTNGRVGIGTTAPTAKLHLAAGTASIAPLKFTSGVSLTTPEAGTMEFADDSLYFTITTGPTRKTFAFTSDLDFYVTKATFDAHTILYATTDNTPAALSVTEQTLVGRLTGGNISAVVIGIADNNIVQIDSADVADNEYARFTAAGLESRSTSEVLSDIGAAASTHATTHLVGGADTVFPADPNADRYLMWDDDPGQLVWAELAGGGDVTATANMTDNTLIKGDGGAKGIQDTGITVDDSENMSGVATLGCTTLNVSGILTSNTQIISSQASDTAATSPLIDLRRERDGDPTQDVADNDYLGEIRFRGYHTDGYYEGAIIRAVVNGTPGSADMPTELIFATSADGSGTPTTRLTIDAAGASTFAGTVALGANNLTMTGSLAATGARITKGWFTDLEVTNDITISGNALAAIYAPISHASTHGVGGADTIFPADPGADKYLMWDDDPGQLVWADSGVGGGATTALDNLASVAINTALVSDTDNTDALGTTAIAWSDLFLGNGAVITFNSAPSTMDITVTHSANTLTVSGAGATTFALGTNAIAGNLGIHNAGTLTLYEAGDNFNVTLACNADEAVATLTGGIDITGIATFSSNTVIMATKKLYFDGGGNTYIEEPSGDILDFYVGGVKAISITESTEADVTFSDGIIVPDDIGVTGTRVNKGWFVDIESTNMPTVGGTSLSDTFVAKATYDAHTVLYATADNTPAALSVTEQTLVGRLTGGNISAVAIGISDNNIVQIDGADIADNEYARFTAAGLESRTAAEVLADIAAVPLAGGTMTGDIQLGETLIKLDATLSGDATWSGISTTGTLGATIAVGDLLYLNADDSRWELVDANLSDGYNKQLGISLTAGNDGDSANILVFGKIRSAAFPAFTVGSVLYMSETAGDITHTQPTTADVAIRVIGYALTAEDLLFNPSNDYITHT